MKTPEYYAGDGRKFFKITRTIEQSNIEPSLQKEIDFYTSLLSLMTTSPLLRHKQKMEQHINYLKQDMQRERKSDFMKDEFYN